MNKDELLAKFQRLGKVLMTPVLILPIAGILQGFGNAFTSPTLTAAVPWLAAPGFAIFFSILKAAASIVMNNIPVIFSICLWLRQVREGYRGALWLFGLHVHEFRDGHVPYGDWRHRSRESYDGPEHDPRHHHARHWRYRRSSGGRNRRMVA